jgi:hypothetical protein
MVSSGWRWWRVGVDFGSDAGEEDDGVEYSGGEEGDEEFGCGIEVYGGGNSKISAPSSSLLSMGGAFDVLATLS